MYVRHPFNGKTVEDLSLYVQNELLKLEGIFKEFVIDSIQFTRHNTEPNRRGKGHVFYADGTNWNPGYGEGPYVWLGDEWSPLFLVTGIWRPAHRIPDTTLKLIGKAPRFINTSIVASPLSTSTSLTSLAPSYSVSDDPQTYSTIVTWDNPTAYWRLNETTGTTMADSIGSNDGTIAGDYTLGVTGATTDGDKAVSFDYVSTEPKITLTSTFTGTLGSIEAWVKFDNTTSTDLTVFAQGDPSVGDKHLRLRVENGKFTFRHRTIFDNDRIITDNAFAKDVWHHVVLTSSGTAWKIYINGNNEALTVEAGSNTGDWFNELTAGSYSAWIGYDETSGPTKFYFEGDIDEVAVYPTELSQQQITAHYEAGKGI